MCRRESCSSADLRPSQRGVGHMEGAAIDSLAIHEAVVGRYGYRASVARIHVIVVVGAIDVVDDGGIANKRVVDVHVTNVGAAAAIPRMKGFAPTEREP